MTMPQTKQQMFDKVATHLMTQQYNCSEATKISSGACLYRDGKGGMCAVGCLIPDSMYQEEMEYNRVGHLIDYGFKIPDVIKKFLPLANDLQNIHDNYMPNKHLTAKQKKAAMEIVRDELILCALENKLDIPEILTK